LRIDGRAIMKKTSNKIWNFPVSFYLLGASFMLVMAFTIVDKNIDGMSSKIVFVGSIITTGAAAITPLLSLKYFNLKSYNIKMYSVYVGVVLGLISMFLFFINNNGIELLFNYSSKGLLWIVNISLLLFNLAILEIENNDAQMRGNAEKFIEMKKELIERDRELIRKNEEIAKLLEQEIEKKGHSIDNE
jgi:hypothetical protein